MGRAPTVQRPTKNSEPNGRIHDDTTETPPESRYEILLVALYSGALGLCGGASRHSPQGDTISRGKTKGRPMTNYGAQPDFFTQQPTLASAQAKVEGGKDKGIVCPCCEQFVKRYRRKIHATMAACLIVLYRSGPAMTSQEVGKQLVRLKTAYSTGDLGKLRYWGLVVDLSCGRWGITNEGRLFVQDEHQVRRLAVIYDGKCTGHEGPLIGIRDALGDRFDYPELMRGAK